jgi:PhzF family phenazine biosynthesis protein
MGKTRFLLQSHQLVGRKISSMSQRSLATSNYWLVDAFTQVSLKGNPASVIYLRDINQLDETWMHRIANETNSPVTCFISKNDNGANEDAFNIRWLTPTKELELCGHATLAASHVLYHDLKLVSYPNKIDFSTKYSGLVSAIGKDLEGNKMIELTFPISPFTRTVLPTADLNLLCDLFQIKPEDILLTASTQYDIAIVLKSLKTFRSLPETANIDFQRMKEINTTRGIMVTCLGENHQDLNTNSSDTISSNDATQQKNDFQLRMFLPRYGIDEDHVSGSAFSAVGTFWRDFLLERTLLNNRKADGSIQLTGYQNSSRGGEVVLSWPADNSTNSIQLAGNCKIIVRGELLL